MYVILFLLYSFLPGLVVTNNTIDVQAGLVLRRGNDVFYGTYDPLKDLLLLDLSNILNVGEHFDGISYDAGGKVIYFVGNNAGVYKWEVNGTLHKLPFGIDVTNIDASAYDWVTGNLYLLDNSFCQIYVCNTKTYFCGIVFRMKGNCKKFGQIALDPIRSHMYWTTKESSSIWTSGMDGSNPTALFTGNIKDPNAIVLNYDDNRLYWVDEGKKTIESCRLDGSGTKRLYADENLSDQTYFSVFNSYVFWMKDVSDFLWAGIIQENLRIKSTSSREIKTEFTFFIQGIIIISPESQPPRAVDPCSLSKCSHICVLKPKDENQHLCICPINMKLTDDNNTCVGREQDNRTLAFRSESEIFMLTANFVNGFSKFERIGKVNGSLGDDPRRISYIQKHNLVSWLNNEDGQARVLYNEINSSDAQIVADIGFSKPVAIAYDWITGNHYIQDRDQGKIVVCNNSTKWCIDVIHLKTGFHQDLVLDPMNGSMYWVMTGDDSGVNSSIWKAGMDGANPTILVGHGLENPVSITMDYIRKQLYWLDVDKKVIETCDVNGKERQIVLSTGIVEVTEVIQFAEDEIFLQSTSHEKLWAFNIQEGILTTVVYNKTDQASDEELLMLKLVDSPSRDNPCKNSNCSHICTLSQNHTKPFRCGCPTGMLLSVDGKTCRDTGTTAKLIIGTKNILKLLTLGQTGKDIFETITLRNVSSIDGIVYNAIKNTLVINNKASNKIVEYNIEHKRLMAVVTKDIKSVTCMDIDIIAQNLYWLDDKKETLELMSLESKARKVLRHGYRNGQDISVVPELGVLYISQVRSHIGYIWKMNLDGKHEEAVKVSEDIAPTLLFYDRELRITFWVDRSDDTIQSTTANKTEIAVYDLEQSAADLLAFRNTLYWTEKNSKDVFFKNLRLDDSDKLKYKVAPRPPKQPFKLAIMDPSTSRYSNVLEHHECSRRNIEFRKCSHICITFDGLSGRCECPAGLTLNNKNLTCLNCSQDPHMCKNDESAENLLHFSSGHIVMIVVIATLIASSLIFVICYMGLRMRQKDQIISDLEIREFRHGKNSDNNGYLEDNHIFNAKYKEDLEIGKHEFAIETSTIIGSGNFGVVYKSYMARFKSEVAVKAPKAATAEEIRSVLCEIKILGFVGDHPNILKLLGAYTKELSKGVVLVVTELCSNGSLLNHLRVVTTKIPQQDLIQHLFRFCEEIAMGMEYLAEKRVVHGDLWPRNVLLDENYKCKICDFGLSRKVERYATYIKQTHEPLPWAWLAVESLAQLEFTLKSDIWSMGVTYWEIFTLGAVPYVGETCNLAFIESLKNGMRLSKPDLLSTDEFEQILKCWAIDPVERPDASALKRFFSCQGDSVYLRI